MQAMSKLDFYSARLCSAVDRAVAADLANFPPREFNSLLWVFVHYRHAPSNAFWGSLSSHLIATDERGSAASTADADAASASGGERHVFWLCCLSGTWQTAVHCCSTCMLALSAEDGSSRPCCICMLIDFLSKPESALKRVCSSTGTACSEIYCFYEMLISTAGSRWLEQACDAWFFYLPRRCSHTR